MTRVAHRLADLAGLVGGRLNGRVPLALNVPHVSANFERRAIEAPSFELSAAGASVSGGMAARDSGNGWQAQGPIRIRTAALLQSVISKLSPGLEQRMVFTTCGGFDEAQHDFFARTDNPVVYRYDDFAMLRGAIDSLAF